MNTDLSEELTWIDVRLQALGLGWGSQRVRDYLDRVSKKEGRPINSKHDLPDWAIKSLSENLLKLMQEQGKCPGSLDQPIPIGNASIPIWDLVIADMKVRDNSGRQKYGVPLQAGNGRDALADAYQEALDLCVYLRQAIEERKLSLPKKDDCILGGVHG